MNFNTQSKRGLKKNQEFDAEKKMNRKDAIFSKVYRESFRFKTSWGDTASNFSEMVNGRFETNFNYLNAYY